MAEPDRYDLVVIGGGPGGYVGAIRAAQLGMKVACVERDRLGGVCLNWGCIPTKALLAGAQFYNELKHEAASWGIEADNVRHNWQKVIGRSRAVADNLNKGVAFLFKKNKITHVQGQAHIPSAGCVQVADASGKPGPRLATKNILICTGASPRPLPGVDFDGDKVISSKEAMTLPQQPKELLIVGAGAIGMEFAYFYSAFGTKVTVIEMMDRLLPIEDDEVCAGIAKAYRRTKIECLTSTKTLGVTKTNSGVELKVAPVGQEGDAAQVRTLTGDKVLVAIGVQGRYDGLFSPSLGIETYKDHIKVDKASYRTNVPGIYAVGDVIGPPWLAHVASEEAVVCVELLAGHEPTSVDYDAIPGCTYCQPQVASVGLTERACKERGLAYKVGKFPFQASGKAQAAGHTQGFVKLITDEKYGEILGAHMIGDSVTELIAEMGLAKRLEATAGEVIATIHGHPTLSEAVHEAALGTQDRMVHF